MKQSDLPKLAAQFPKEGVHWRAQTVTKDGKKALALAYLDARDVMDRLDEVCGPAGWQTRHGDAGNGKLACEIGIYVEGYSDDHVAQEGEWIWKSDGAGATDVEADKGAFSDALKRAAVSWGIGRYLYDLGNTYVPCEARDTGQKDKWGNIKWRFVRFTANPWDYVRRKTGPAEPVIGKLNKTKLQEKLRKFNDDLKAVSDLAALEGLLHSNSEALTQCKEDMPSWWFTKDTPDAAPGLAMRIATKRQELEDAAKQHPGLNPDDPQTYAAE